MRLSYLAMFLSGGAMVVGGLFIAFAENPRYEILPLCGVLLAFIGSVFVVCALIYMRIPQINHPESHIPSEPKYKRGV